MTVYNFNPGPAILPTEVLRRAQEEMLDYHGTGLSILETSHRSTEYEAINASAEARFKSLLGLGDEYRVLFVQGGASLQFAMLPMNRLPRDGVADYILTGAWSEKARDEAMKFGRVQIAATTEAEGYRRVPRADEIKLSDAPVYVHLTSNNTIYGTQWHEWPETDGAPLVADMSSDIFSRPLDAGRFSLIYGGAQKNIGPAGVVFVLARTDWLAGAPANVPTVLSYQTYAQTNSLYNTPPVFAVYLLDLVLEWIANAGGLSAMGRRNEEKAAIIYDAVDGGGGYYTGHAEPASRSRMNLTFRLPSPELEKRFVAEATAAKMIGLAGHRSVGGVRASLYNAMDAEGCRALAGFMNEFARRNG